MHDQSTVDFIVDFFLQTIPQRECGVLIIGAGLEALSIVSRLPPSVLQVCSRF